MKLHSRAPWVVIGALCLAAVFGLSVGLLALLNPAITRYLEGDSFRAELEKETAKGLHFPTSNYSPIGRKVDDLHIDGGEVGIQTYEPTPEPSPAKPWFHLFLRQRIYLTRVWSEPADVTWRGAQ